MVAPSIVDSWNPRELEAAPGAGVLSRGRGSCDPRTIFCRMIFRGGCHQRCWCWIAAGGGDGEISNGSDVTIVGSLDRRAIKSKSPATNPKHRCTWGNAKEIGIIFFCRDGIDGARGVVDINT